MLVHDGPFVQRDSDFECWQPVSKRAVRALGIVVASPLLDDDLGLLQGIEDYAVKQFVSEPGIEALDKAVLPG